KPKPSRQHRPRKQPPSLPRKSLQPRQKSPPNLLPKRRRPSGLPRQPQKPPRHPKPIPAANPDPSGGFRETQGAPGRLFHDRRLGNLAIILTFLVIESPWLVSHDVDHHATIHTNERRYPWLAHILLMRFVPLVAVAMAG